MATTTFDQRTNFSETETTKLLKILKKDNIIKDYNDFPYNGNQTQQLSGIDAEIETRRGIKINVDFKFRKESSWGKCLKPNNPGGFDLMIEFDPSKKLDNQNGCLFTKTQTDKIISVWEIPQIQTLFQKKSFDDLVNYIQTKTNLKAAGLFELYHLMVFDFQNLKSMVEDLYNNNPGYFTSGGGRTFAANTGNLTSRACVLLSLDDLIRYNCLETL